MLCFQLKTENDDIFEVDTKPRIKKGHPGKKYFVVVVLLGILFLGYIAIAYVLFFSEYNNCIRLVYNKI